MTVINRRPFQGDADKGRMIALAQRSENVHTIDLPYRLSSWALDDSDNIALWEDENGRLLAWAILNTPFWTIDFALHPNAQSETLSHVLKWADARILASLNTAYGHPMWFVNVFADQYNTRGDLETSGFVCQSDVGENSWSKVFLRKTLEDAAAAPCLPEGFSIRTLAETAGVREYVSLHRAAFGGNAMTEEWAARTRSAPGFRPDLDLVITAPDGQLAGFCVGWFDHNGPDRLPSGQVEPMGVAPEFQRLGLGGALLAELSRRLSGLGAVQVFVESDNRGDGALALYKSSGFTVVKDILVYRKDYDDGEDLRWHEG